VIQYHYIIIIYSQHSPVTFFYITLDLLNFSELLKRNLPSENVNTVCQKKKDQFLIERVKNPCLLVFISLQGVKHKQ